MTTRPANHNDTLRWWLAEWDADYNRSAGAPRPDDRKDTTTDA